MLLMSWNILSPTLTDAKQQDWMTWSNRLPVIIARIRETNADYVFLQEVKLDGFESDFASLMTDYQCARHERNKSRTCAFGNVIFWKIGELKRVVQKSRVLHVELRLDNNEVLILSNAHLPAGSGLDGYKSRVLHLESCAKVWKDEQSVIFGGDLNDSVWNPFGIAFDIRNLGFTIDDTPKSTCYSRRSNMLHDLDHIVARSRVSARFVGHTSVAAESQISSRCCIATADQLPTPEIPSDHLPVLYQITT
jgi:endonuclease/exonuclease/phosphatase (EEP) superfamily protein YafD